MKKVLTATEVMELINGDTRPVLLNVLPEEAFVAQAISGSRNACIYETAFLDNVRDVGVSPDDAIIVYGAGAPSLESEVAAARLGAAGFSRVGDFRGGLAEWRAQGFPLGGAGVSAPAPVSGRFEVDTESSVIRWIGRNLFNHHEGTLRLASGFLDVEHDVLTKAEFVIDMRSIACTDIPDQGIAAMLLRHLAHDDFFATDVHPTASYSAHSAEPIGDATAGTPNYLIKGDFTLRGITKALDFPAVIAARDADHLTGQALIEIDRTDFGSKYGSGKFFAALGQHVVNDRIHLHLKLHAARA